MHTDPRPYIVRLAACGIADLPEWVNSIDPFDSRNHFNVCMHCCHVVNLDTATLVAEALATRWLHAGDCDPKFVCGRAVTIRLGSCEHGFHGADTLESLTLAVEAACGKEQVK